ncbi:hypothetical protein Pelo_14117 [Pelomyxa schiedti]|nr:hypothetical protein Pelo_14117 [Pelomyxa schiedti]
MASKPESSGMREQQLRIFKAQMQELKSVKPGREVYVRQGDLFFLEDVHSVMAHVEKEIALRTNKSEQPSKEVKVENVD